MNLAELTPEQRVLALAVKQHKRRRNGDTLVALALIGLLFTVGVDERAHNPGSLRRRGEVTRRTP